MVTNAQRKWVVTLVGEIKTFLLLHQWTVEIDFSDEPHPDTTDDTAVDAMIGILPRYFSARMTVFPEFWGDWRGEDDRVKTIFHEMTHCITEETASIGRTRRNSERATDANEKTTQLITNIAFPIFLRQRKTRLKRKSK